MSFRSFEELAVWKEARKIRVRVSKVAKTFPLEEKYRLTDQILRSSRSSTANIAEGYGRFHYQENIQFCRVARGSLSETVDHLICAFDEKYISIELLNELCKEIENCIKILNGYIAYLKKAKDEN